MSAIFFRCVLPTSWAISQISRLFFRPHTTRRPLRISRYEPPAAKLPATRTLLRSNMSFHERALELLRAQHPDDLTVTDGPSNSLRMVVAETQRSNAIPYHDMNALLEERYKDGSLANLTELELSVPWFESNKTLTHIPVGSGTITTPTLTSFKWSGSLLLLPKPWRTLSQLDFSAIVKLSLTDCELTIQDCLFIFERSPELKEFTAMTISAGIKEFSTVPERAGLQKIVAFNNLSQSYICTVSNAWPRKPSNLQVQCTQLSFIAVSARVDITSLWDALESCNQLREIYLKTTDDLTAKCIDDLPWNKHNLDSVTIETPHAREVVDQWIVDSDRRPDTSVEVKPWI